MSVDRKQFLQLAITGGLGTLLGGSVIPDKWSEGGVSLTSVSRQSVVMGAMISFQVVAETEKAGYEAIRRAEQTFRSLEKKFSMYDEKSEMAMLARKAGTKPVVVSDESVELLRFAKNVYQQSDNYFDVTVEPAMKRWGFRDNPGKVISRPTDEELRNLECIIGSDKIIIENNNILLAEQGMAIDTGGIAGGYALDKAIDTMKKCDISASFINFSGDVHCFGKPFKGQKWPVYLVDPQTQQPIADPVELSNEALSTSGAYQNRRHNSKEQSWGHLLLPNQAEPVEPVGSVSAVHSSAIYADAWSTASFVGADVPSEVRTVLLPGS
ncbi:thiamine biosynthesis lipoprotein [Fodinibius salinus]|uniref:FAD:protein FMN transferase n=1 Tax=Fodinibius salinus TaxID=860790 RepID=A0A5D3YIA7_9BACT|nr:FAD:protein FMN transferase [Fodinibius salinus]TYP93295.1 thiamine biosynthesis lipoprotein [Fodinibius salinus]